MKRKRRGKRGKEREKGGEEKEGGEGRGAGAHMALCHCIMQLVMLPHCNVCLCVACLHADKRGKEAGAPQRGGETEALGSCVCEHSAVAPVQRSSLRMQDAHALTLQQKLT